MTEKLNLLDIYIDAKKVFIIIKSLNQKVDIGKFMILENLILKI